MRKWKILALVLLASAAAAALAFKDQLNRNVIVLKSGKSIVADRIWESGTDLFYENDREIHFIKLSEINAVESLTFAHLARSCAADVGRHVDGWRKGLDPLFRSVLEFTRRSGSTTLWLVLGSAAAPVMLFWGLRRIRNRPVKKTIPKPSPAPAKEASPELPNRADVVRFFLNLYRHQVGAGPDVPTEFVQLPSPPGSANQIYELRVKNGGDWVNRRMTLGPLAEDSGSKSKCYYVIFDRHLVVKIPPKPVCDFEAYVSSIKKEGHIVERLAPKECIIPKVSVILSLVHQLPSLPGITPDQVEEKHVSWLRKNPEYQNYLKIKGTFVYFMDLSRYYFLSHIIDGFHDLSVPMRAELAATAELIRYPAKFKERYGDADEAVGFEIRDLYHQCEAEIRQLLKDRGKASAASPYRIQSWFLRYLEKKEIAENDPELPAGATGGIESIFSRQFEKHHRSVEAYLAAVSRFAGHLSLEQNRAVMSGIVSNLLDLLAWLNARSVAMRDLKPDNILVAGDPQYYPAFLRSAADYSLGFIDVETAVFYGRTGEETIRQPLLGGTPYYATPSHLFPNPVLEDCFGDMARLLHLQDWHAVMVMIYKVVTGELLFESTAKLFIEIKTRVIDATRQGEPLAPQFEDVSRTFWRSAAAEFRAKMKNREKALRWIEADIPKSAKALFTRVLQRDIESIQASTRAIIESQVLFSTPAGRDQLHRSSSARICQIIEELQARSKTGKGGPASIDSGQRLLRSLSTLKALAERKSQLLSALGTDAVSRMSAYDLLILMFNSLLKGMYREGWKPFAEEPAGPACPANDELSLATTI